MAVTKDKYQRSIQACIENGRRLLEDAEWTSNRASTGLALAMLAQEECAKAFLLALVRDEILPWTEEVRRSLIVHDCKHLVMMTMEWLMVVNEQRMNEALSRSTEASSDVRPIHELPSDVATAINIYRHEMIERLGKRKEGSYPEWRGSARKVAKGHRDRKKQRALYVSITDDGDVASLPPTSEDGFTEEFTQAKALIEFAGDVERKCLFALHEYELFADIFRSMFHDLTLDGAEKAQLEEVYPSDIPGVVFVRRAITVAQVGTSEPVGEHDSSAD